ncbi:hypothetical protein [Nitratireductor kimnyeongensis]
MADLIERLKRPGTWARHADDIIASSATEELIRDDAPFEAAAEIERLRAKLAEAEKVIEPFANVLTAPDLDPCASIGDVITVGHLRAAAEWMEKGDE